MRCARLARPGAGRTAQRSAQRATAGTAAASAICTPSPARIVLDALQGTQWTCVRNISGSVATPEAGNPLGAVVARVWFRPATAASTPPGDSTATGSGSSSSASSTAGGPCRPPPDLLYREEGTFLTSAGQRYRSTREYVYWWDPARPEQLQVWFSAGGGGRRWYEFMQLEFDAQPPGAAADEGPGPSSSSGRAEAVGGCWWVEARGDHLCGGRDLYRGVYRFVFTGPLAASSAAGGGSSSSSSESADSGGSSPAGPGPSLSQLRITYRVTGPGKDYTADALYTRLAPDTQAEAG